MEEKPSKGTLCPPRRRPGNWGLRMCSLVLGGGADKALWDVLVVLWPVPMAPLPQVASRVILGMRVKYFESSMVQGITPSE